MKGLKGEMKAEIIAVGTEILLGNIVNTNAKYIAEQLAHLGLSVYYQSVVGDNEHRIMDTVLLALSRADILIITGGLGPTSDDLTKEAVAKALNLPLVLHEETKEKLIQFFKKSQCTMPSTNLKQAYIPKDSKVLDNANGTAPGLMISRHNQCIFLLPGPPNELQPLFKRYVAKVLKGLDEGIIHSKVLKLCGIGESKVESILAPLLLKQTNPTLAPYAKEGEVHLRITAKAQSLDLAKTLICGLEEQVREKLNPYIYTDDERALESVILDEIKQRNLTLCTAESCTGGLLSGRLINCSGVSEIFKEGYITYSNASKVRLLGVLDRTLEQHGAVSKETAYEMAKGAASASETDIAVSITGIAGPSGGSKEKPVGLVYIGLYYKGAITVKRRLFTGNRQKIRNRTVVEALIMLRNSLLEDSMNK